MSEKIEIKFRCGECGGTVIELPDDYTDDSVAICKACRRPFGTWGDVKAQASKAAADCILGGLGPNWKRG